MKYDALKIVARGADKEESGGGVKAVPLEASLRTS
jgi:hypothetical protein